MSLRWQEVVVIPEAEEDLACECCGQPARRAEGLLLHREEEAGRFSVRWRPGHPDHPARHVLYLGNWRRRTAEDRATLAVADFLGHPDPGFRLLDEAPALMQALAPWHPRLVRRADAIGQPLGERLFALLDAVHVKDPRLQEIRGWAA